MRAINAEEFEMALDNEIKYDQLNFDRGNGLIPTIVQNISGLNLYLESTSRESLEKTIETGRNWRFSKTQNKLIEVGSESGKTEYVRRILTNCYADTLLYIVEQKKEYACHEGYRTCFFRELNSERKFVVNQDRVIDPKEIYGGIERRTEKVTRKTNETDISAELDIHGNGNYDIKNPIGFFTHMLETFTKHGLFDIKIDAKGDLEVDQHHTIEDIGIVLGQTFKKALSSKKGINRAGYFVYPMDEALAVVAVDIGGRPYLQYDVEFKRRFCGNLDTDLLEDFFYGFAVNLGANLVVRMPYGRSDHHKMEAIFKAFGKAMKMACSTEKRAIEDIPSTKGAIENDNNS
jgi:imidazoleglycerol-phosphate dehydratase